MNQSFVITCLSVSLVVIVLAFVREARLRRALQQLLSRLLAQWRSNHASTKTAQLIPATLLMALMTGCSDDEMIRRSLQYQAEQNAQMARQTQQVVETSRELVELQQNLEEGVQTERQSLDRQHEEMEAERRTIAHQRHRDPLIAAAIINASVLLACIAPLLLAFWVIRNSWSQESSGVDELLIHELTTDTPVLLPRPSLPMLPAEVELEPVGVIEGPASRAAGA